MFKTKVHHTNKMYEETCGGVGGDGGELSYLSEREVNEKNLTLFLIWKF